MSDAEWAALMEANGMTNLRAQRNSRPAGADIYTPFVENPDPRFRPGYGLHTVNPDGTV